MDSNSITKADVAEFEKMTGMDVGQMAKMLDAAKGRLPPDMRDTVDLLRRLAKIKKDS